MKMKAGLCSLIIVSLAADGSLGASPSNSTGTYQHPFGSPIRQNMFKTMYAGQARSTAARVGPNSSSGTGGALTNSSRPLGLSGTFRTGPVFNPLDRNYFGYDRTLNRRWFDLWETANQGRSAKLPTQATMAGQGMNDGSNIFQTLNPYTFSLDTLLLSADNTTVKAKIPAAPGTPTPP